MPEQLTRVTVDLTAESMAALEDAAAMEGDSKTTTINRALQFYCLFVFARRAGRRVWVGRRKWSAGEATWD